MCVSYDETDHGCPVFKAQQSLQRNGSLSHQTFPVILLYVHYNVCTLIWHVFIVESCEHLHINNWCGIVGKLTSVFKQMQRLNPIKPKTTLKQ